MNQSQYTVRVWNLQTGAAVLTFQIPSAVRENAVALSADGKLVAVGNETDDGGTIAVWNVETQQQLHQIEAIAYRIERSTYYNPYSDADTDPEPRGVISVAISPWSSTLICGIRKGEPQVWDLQAGTELHYFKAHARAIHCLAASPDGRRLASGGADHVIQLWDLQTGENLARLEGHTSFVRAIAFSPDGTTLASGSWDNTVRLWQVGAA